MSEAARPAENPVSGLYDRDFYAWTAEQAALLRAGRFDAADIANIVEEIETLGRTEKRELVNRLVVLITHLLKWQYQPARRGNSWRLSIEEQRFLLTDHLRDNPSLKAMRTEATEDAYQRATFKVERETGIKRQTLPDTCPWSFDQIMTEGFLP